MTDIVERLRYEALHTGYKHTKPWDLLVEAADEIEALRAERDNFYMRHRMRHDIETKAQATEIERLRAELAAMCANFDAMRDEKNRLRAALAEQRGEPVATYSPCCGFLRRGRCEPDVVHDGACLSRHGGELGPTVYLYAAPQQREPLTDERIRQIVLTQRREWTTYPEPIGFARAVEAAHGITGDTP